MGAYNQDVLLIHIPKCAGWSIKTYCREHLPGWLMPDDPKSGLPLGHVRLRDIERFTGRSPDSFKMILIPIRNPFEQQLSQLCYWAKRYLTGGRHIHDQLAWQYVAETKVQREILLCALRGQKFAFTPQLVNLTGFVCDPECDFHVWYEDSILSGKTAMQQFTSKEIKAEYHRGLYRYWMTVDDEIPDNVKIVRVEDNAAIVAALQPFADHELPPLPVLNRSPWSGRVIDYYTPLARDCVVDKFRWTFGLSVELPIVQPYYPKWLELDD